MPLPLQMKAFSPSVPPLRRFGIWVVVAFFVTGNSAISVAQPPSTDSPGLIKDGIIQTNQRVWVEGKDNRPVLNITLQELQELEQLARRATELPLILTGARVSANVEGNVANIRATVNMSLEAQSIPTIRRFDLHFKNCQLVEPAKFKSESPDDDNSQNSLIPTEDGYRWLHLSDQAGAHSVELVAQALIAQNADRQTFTLDLPQTSTSIELDLLLPPNAAEERVRAEDIIESRSVDDNGVRLRIRSRGGNFTLNWRQSTAQVQVSAVEAKCDTQFEPTDLLDASQFWSATSTISIRWYGGQANNRVQIALPQGAQWSSLPYSELDRFRITTVMTQTVDGAADALPIEVLEIENLDPSELPSIENLKLQWRWIPIGQTVDRLTARMKIQLPEIKGADSQEGSLEIVYPSSFQASFSDLQGVRFLQQSRLSNLVDRQQIQFQYRGADSTLAIAFRKEQFQTTVQPIYRVHVYQDKLQLTGWIRCSFVTDNTEIGLLPGEWTLDADSPCKLANAAIPDSTEFEPLLVQQLEDGSWTLASRADNSGSETTKQLDQVWRFVAWRNWNSQDSQFQFQIPQLDRGRSQGEKSIDHASGSILLTAENYLSVQANDAKLVGLIRDGLNDDLTAYALPQHRQPAVYRFQRHGELPTWIGSAESLERQISFEHLATLDVQESRILVQEDFPLQILNRPANDMRVRLRNDVVPIRAQSNNIALSFQEIAPVENDSSAEGWKTYQLIGFPEVIGDATLTIQTSLAWKTSALEVESTTSSSISGELVEVPLARFAIEGDVRQTRPTKWSYQSARTLSIHSSPDNALSSGETSELPEGKNTIDLSIKPVSDSESLVATTGPIWLQSILNGADRRDRFVARVRSSNKQIRVQLPEQAQLDRVAVDGRRLSSDAAPYDYSSRRAQIDLPDDQEHTVEILYVVTEPLSWASSLRITAARIVDAQSQDRFYWQLVTPSIYHLGWCPKELTADWRWRWNVASWNRTSEEDQTSLEQRLLATSAARLPAGTNSYVMSGFGPAPDMRVWVLSRFSLWLPVGALAIGLTMLVLSVPAVRNPTTILVLSAGLITAAVIWPDISMLLAQTSAISIGLVALIWITQAAVSTKANRRSVFSARSITSTDYSDQPKTITRSARGQSSAINPSTAGTE